MLYCVDTLWFGVALLCMLLLVFWFIFIRLLWVLGIDLILVFSLLFLLVWLTNLVDF